MNGGDNDALLGRGDNGYINPYQTCRKSIKTQD